MPYMTRILGDLKAEFDHVEVVHGWETRGSSSFAPAGVVAHWTAGPARSTKRPSLNIVTNGRPRLPGPLCNVYLDRNGIPVIIAAGRANHAGAGEWQGVKGNSGFYGIEAEAAGNHDWTPAQRAAYPRLIAALLRGLGRGAHMACGHSEYALPRGRKVDINGYTTTQLRADVARILTTTPTPTPAPEDPDMAGIIKRKGSHEHYVYDGVVLRYLTDVKELGLLKALGARTVEADGAVIDRIPTVQRAVWTDRKVRRGGKDIAAIQELADTGSIAREIRDLLKGA